MNCSNPSLLIDPATVFSSTSGDAKKPSAASSTNKTVVHVHPLVLLSILDHHTRRQEGAGRVIGTLLGQRSTDGNSSIIHVTNCFAVPHAEHGEEVAIGKDFNRQMLSLHARANRKDVVVGWYATALPPSEAEAADANIVLSGNADKNRYRCIADTSSLIHEFYAGEASATSNTVGSHGTTVDVDPIHLVVDTSLTFDTIGVKAYRSTPVSIRGEPFANLFHEIPVRMRSTDSERICIDKMIKGLSNVETRAEYKQENGNEHGEDDDADGVKSLQLSMERLLQLIETASNYVDSIVAGTTPMPYNADQIGRKLYDALASVPRVREEIFDAMFHDNLQDLLMVSYLSQLTKTQLVIAEKLNETLTLGV